MFRVGLIGCGRISGKHIEAAAKNDDIMRFSALCDTVASNAESKNEALRSLTNGFNAEIFTDYVQMVDSAKLNAVCIATDSGSHFDIAMNCIERGMHVLVEKPMAMTPVQCREMIGKAKENGVLLGVCHQNRFNPPIKALKKAINDGKLGKIYAGNVRVLWARDKAYYDAASWRGTRLKDGGCLMNQCIHGIDALLWLMGGVPVKINSITRNFSHPYIEMEDYGNILIEFDNGAVASIEGTVNTFDKNLKEELTILGQDGTVVIGGLAMNAIEEWRVRGEAESLEELQFKCSQDIDGIYGFGHTPLYRNFINAALGREDLLVDGNEGKRAVELIAGIYEKEGRL